MGKSTISMAMFNSFLYVYQRYPVNWKVFMDRGEAGGPGKKMSTVPLTLNDSLKDHGYFSIAIHKKI